MKTNPDNPVLYPQERKHAGDYFSASEVRLANRNAGIHLEMLEHDITPIGMHYLLSHFDIPSVPAKEMWRLDIGGLVAQPQSLGLSDLESYPALDQAVTLECAGNGRALLRPRWPNMPWCLEAVGTARWGGTSLGQILAQAAPDERATTVVFSGADTGVDAGHLHRYERALSIEDAMQEEVMLAWRINEQPLPPQHGFPLRLVVPGWYGMASVKWLQKITLTDQPFNGHQQANTYMYRQSEDDPGLPVSRIRVRSLMIPPGLPDYLTRQRVLEAGETHLMGRAWSGAGVDISRVDIAIQALDSPTGEALHADLEWLPAEMSDAANDRFSWRGWHHTWHASPGRYRLYCRATDSAGDTQPLDARWDRAGLGNNAVQRIDVWVEEQLPRLDEQ